MISGKSVVRMRGSRSTSRVVDRLHVCVLVTRISPCAFIEALFIRSAPVKGAATTLGGVPGSRNLCRRHHFVIWLRFGCSAGKIEVWSL